MSLQVWLPLNGDLENKGLSGYTFSNSATSFITVDNSGKIGKCYNFNSTSSNNGIYSADNGFMSKYINNKSWTIGLWAKTNSTDTCPISLSYGLRMFIGNSTHISLYNSGNTVNCNSSISGNDNQWHHFCVTYDTVTNNIKFYVDGVNTGNASYSSGTYASSWTNGIYIGRDPNNSTVNDHYLYRGKLNDVRIYDHCLSEKEVKEISKGLALHYKLDDGYVESTTNLLANTAISFSPLTINMTYTNNNGQYTITTTNYMGSYTTGSLRLNIPLDSLKANTIQAISFKVKNIQGNSNFNKYDWCDSGTHTIKAYNYGDFLYCKGTVTRSTYDNVYHFLDFDSIDENSKFIIYDIQLEDKDHATPYTPTNRTGNIVYDNSGYGYNGIINGALTINSDSAKYSKCTVFDGNTASITLGNLSTICPDGNFTFNCWIYKDGTWSTKTWETILGGPGGFELETKYSSTNSPVIVNYSWGKTSMPYNLNEWTMVTMTRNSSETKYYINGDLVGTGTAGTIPSGNYFIGAWSNSAGQNYKGKVSDVRIYNTVLSESDIKELYKTSASIDKNGNLYCRELVEV